MKAMAKQLLMALGLAVLAQGAMAAGDATAGQSKAAACGACHGADGNSAMATFPKLAGLGEKYLVKQMYDIKKGRAAGGRDVPEMTGQLDAMSNQDIEDIAAYFNQQNRQLSGASNISVQLPSGKSIKDAEVLALGEKLYRGGNMETKVPACTGCHSPTGQGNGPAGYPAIGGQFPGYIEKQLRDFRAGNRLNDGDAKIMRQIAEHMSDAEIIAVANFIGGLTK